jgi:hypothetical protein
MAMLFDGRVFTRVGNEGGLVYHSKGIYLRENLRMDILRDDNGVIQSEHLEDLVKAVPKGFIVADPPLAARALYRTAEAAFIQTKTPSREVSGDVLQQVPFITNGIIITDLKGKGSERLGANLQRLVYRFFQNYQGPNFDATPVLYLHRPTFFRTKIEGAYKWQAQILMMPRIPSTDFYNMIGYLIGVYGTKPLLEDEVEKRERSSRLALDFLAPLLGFEKEVLSSITEHHPFLKTRITKVGEGPIYYIYLQPSIDAIDPQKPIVWGINLTSKPVLSTALITERFPFNNRLKKLDV